MGSVMSQTFGNIGAILGAAGGISVIIAGITYVIIWKNNIESTLTNHDGRIVRLEELKSHSSCSVVEGILKNPATGRLSIASCLQGDILISGGGYCRNLQDINGSFMHDNHPSADRKSWIVDCFSFHNSQEGIAHSFAVCCKP